jgi:Pentapeptide repeats (8 copies)
VTSAVERKQHLQRWALWLSVAIPVAAAVIYLLIWFGPDVIARHDVGHITGSARALDLQKARDAARGRLLTLGAGLFAAGALIFTGRNYGLARRQLELSRQTMALAEQGQQRTLELTEQGQVTDRYTKAIEQLGSNKLDVRIGGIYALERIARDSPADHPTVMEVLAAFVREHSREQWPLVEGTGAIPERATRPDVQAAATVIGRRDAKHDRGQINLMRANLARADLRGADLSGATLFQADLTETVFLRTKLSGAVLHGANLTGAFLISSDLTGARLDKANLTGADLSRADLSRASLLAANLLRAAFIETRLTGADLLAENLNVTSLALAADLHGAKIPAAGPLPQGWVWGTDGRLKRSGS